MELAWVWKSAFLVIVGMMLLRIAGRKSISQMSVATTVIMISIGTTIVQPIANNHLWIAIGSATVFIVSLIMIEQLQRKFDWFEKLMSGSSIVVIEKGHLLPKNLQRIRMTVDQLEMRLRLKGVSAINDVQTATLEPNGEIGIELKRHARPVTVGELERILGLKSEAYLEQSILFKEVGQGGHPTPIDPELQ